MAGPSDDEWIAACRRAVEAQKRVFSEHHGIEARTQYEGVGEGGDNTLVIDRLCEDAIFEELDALHEKGHEFTAISEERGSVGFGSGDSPLRVVIDPIDGSLNARRTIPLHSVSIAVADGDSMDDVTLGYVYEFGAGEEFVATRDSAERDGVKIQAPLGDGLELVALEASKPERVVKAAEVLRDRAFRIRSPGSIAVGLCYVACGRYDGLLTTRSCRSVDAAAGQLIARTAGATVEFAGGGLEDAPLDLSARYDVSAARTPTDLAVLREAQEAVHA
ncbi:MAG: inositol monophosphatase family protein [Solirubrobacterales bacterium]